MKLSKVFLYTLSFILIFFIHSCTSNLFGDVSLKEVKRITSPDHKVDAVLIESDAGATTATSTKVFIVKPGKKVNADSLNLAVFNSDNFIGGDISWKVSKELIVSYKSARIFHYTNFWVDADDYNYKVEVTLNPLP
jgi:hypothetical protein